ncbi:hypothetical protein DFH08DRAFT_651061, partial [Mycena albidolilacea]
IFEMCDTNKLVEAWHHFLKGKFLQGKRNRRIDHLLHILVEQVLLYYSLKQRRQDLGFEGPDVEVKKRQDIKRRSQVYVKDDIKQVKDTKYLVPSQSSPSKLYEVDINTYTCNYLNFPLIAYCKHICAVQRLFDEASDQAAATSQVPDPSAPSPTPSPPLALHHETPACNPLILLAEKMELLAAHLCRSGRKGTLSLPNLEAALDAMLIETYNSGVLPSSIHVAPSATSGWQETRKSMMPAVKMKRKAAGDA